MTVYRKRVNLIIKRYRLHFGQNLGLCIHHRSDQRYNSF